MDEKKTLRDEFAMAIHPAELEWYDGLETIADCAAQLGLTQEEYLKDCRRNYMKIIARLRYQIADAMLEERKGRGE